VKRIALYQSKTMGLIYRAKPYKPNPFGMFPTWFKVLRYILPQSTVGFVPSIFTCPLPRYLQRYFSAADPGGSMGIYSAFRMTGLATGPLLDGFVLETG
jgi:hypothetical protein